MLLQNRNEFYNTLTHNFKKVNFSYGTINRSSIFMYDEISKTDPIYEITQDVFNYIRPEQRVDMSLPLMSWRPFLTEKLIKSGYSPELIYNIPSSMLNFNKSKIADNLNQLNVNWQPKTVFSINDAVQNLNFPILAKSNDSYQSKGVVRFENKESLLKYRYPEDFDLYQEYVPLKEELRLMIFKGKSQVDLKCIMSLSKKSISNKLNRIHNNSLVILNNEQNNELLDNYSSSPFEVKNKSIDSDFKWFYVDQEEVFSKYSNVSDIVKTIFNLNPDMNFITIDLGVDHYDNIFYIESNKVPGLSYHSSLMLYKSIYEDFYYSQLNDISFSKLKDKSVKCVNVTIEFENFRINEILKFEYFLLK